MYAREEGRGSLSGGTISQRIYTVHTHRDGKVVRYEFYEEQDALEAAGLSEEAMSQENVDSSTGS